MRGKDAALRDVYEALEFHKTPRLDVKETDKMTIRQLCEFSGVGRRHVYRVLEQLQDLGLIKVHKLSKRGLYQFRLVHYGDDYSESRKMSESGEVVKLGNKPSQRDVEYQEAIAAIPE